MSAPSAGSSVHHSWGTRRGVRVLRDSRAAPSRCPREALPAYAVQLPPRMIRTLRGQVHAIERVFASFGWLLEFALLAAVTTTADPRKTRSSCSWASAKADTCSAAAASWSASRVLPIPPPRRSPPPAAGRRRHARAGGATAPAPGCGRRSARSDLVRHVGPSRPLRRLLGESSADLRTLDTVGRRCRPGAVTRRVTSGEVARVGLEIGVTASHLEQTSMPRRLTRLWTAPARGAANDSAQPELWSLPGRVSMFATASHGPRCAGGAAPPGTAR
jgi:hypothetical protein